MDSLVEDLEDFLQVEQEAQMGNVQQHPPLLPPQLNFLLHLEHCLDEFHLEFLPEF